MDIADCVATVSYLFLGAFDLKCLDAADSNDQSDLDLADVVYTLSYLFRGGPEPREPFGDLCGLDPTDPDGLDCARYYPCE